MESKDIGAITAIQAGAGSCCLCWIFLETDPENLAGFNRQGSPSAPSSVHLGIELAVLEKTSKQHETNQGISGLRCTIDLSSIHYSRSDSLGPSTSCSHKLAVEVGELSIDWPIKS